MELIGIILLIVIIVGFAGVIGNQTTTLRQLEQTQRTLEQLQQTVESSKRER